MQACSDHSYCVSQALHKAELICENKGLRFTALRRKVLEMIWASHGSAKAYDILDKLKDKDTTAKPPTVYRTLDFLMEHGLIHKLNSLNSYVGCGHPTTEYSECYFLICSECGEIKECCNDKLAKAIADTVKKSRFKPGRVTLEIKGTCPECVRSKQQ